MDSQELANELRKLADDHELLYNVPRRKLEDVLIELRDARISVPRNNGLVVKEINGKNSHIIRLGPEQGLSIMLRALADHFEDAVLTQP